uniref:Uncharacterized protein n=1 Tax=Timema poppense TaxID=170557 RepID=A0A7R9DW21_TIMPO|nr:unnamed protein product [Timema poppensis]
MQSSSKVTPLCSEEVKRRYQDTALVIFKEQQRLVKNSGYLTYGSNRRTLFYTNYGNAPVLVHVSNKLAVNNKVCSLL